MTVGIVQSNFRGWTGGAESSGSYAKELHATSHNVPYIHMGLRDGMESWDREFWWWTPWDILFHGVPWRLRMGWTGWMRSFGEEICVDSINKAKKQADLKSTIRWNRLLREATLWYEWWSLDLVWRSSELFGRPLTLGAWGRLPLPLVGRTEDSRNRGLRSGTQYDNAWCPIYPLGIEEWDGNVQK